MSKQDQNKNGMSLLDYALLDEINKYYDDHNGLIAIDKQDNYNHDGLVDLNNDNDSLIDLDNDHVCLTGLECDGLVGFECDDLVGDVLVSDLSDSEEMGGHHFPANILGFFGGNQKTQFFASFATNGKPHA